MNAKRFYRILLVDDSESDRATYRRYLLADENFDYEIIEAETLGEGLELWRLQSPNLVLVDIHLPDGSGLELLAQIAETSLEKRTPVIAITGQGNERIAVKAMKLGASDYLVKEDITAALLRYCVENTVRKQAQQELQRLNQELERQVEQQALSLQASERNSRMILEMIPDLLLHLDSDGKLLDQIYSKTSNLAKFLPISSNISEVLPPDLLTKQLQVIAQAIATGELQIYEHEFLKNDSTSYEEVRIMPINDQEVLVIVRDISDRKLAEQELKEYQQFLQTLLDTLPLYVFWKNRESVLLGCNQAMAELIGLSSPKEFVQKTHHEFSCTEEELQGYEIDDQEVMKSGQQKLMIQETITLPNGKQIWIETHKAPLRDFSGNIIGVVGIFQDISDRKLAEEKNLKLRDRLQFLLASSPVIIYSCKAYEPHSSTFMSANVEAILGYKAEEFTTQDNFWGNHLHPEDAPRVLSDLSELFKVGIYIHEYRFLHQKGHYVWIHDEMRLVRDEQGNPLEIVGYVIDISDQKQAEAELIEFNYRWRSVLDNIQMIVIEVDQECIVQYINPFFQTISQFTPEEVIGKHWITHFVPQDLILSIEIAFQELKEESKNKYYINPILTKSGKQLMIAWRNFVIEDKARQSVSVIGFGEDITEQYRLERIKSEFLSIVSHELKTPLTTIQASLSLLSEKFINPASEDGEMILTMATDGIDRLVRLVNDIFDAERLESGKLHLKKSDCNTQKIIKDAIAQTQELAKQANININVSPNSYSLYADSDRLVQILINIISNAIKFSPPFSSIDVSIEQQTSYLLFTIRDQGRGIPSEKLEIIFERFQQVDSSDAREQGGTGLGLCISREIVEQHGGKIWVESTVGKGSTFYFTVPHLRL